jgi:hypothetical protein
VEASRPVASSVFLLFCLGAPSTLDFAADFLSVADALIDDFEVLAAPIGAAAS